MERGLTRPVLENLHLSPRSWADLSSFLFCKARGLHCLTQLPALTMFSSKATKEGNMPFYLITWRHFYNYFMYWFYLQFSSAVFYVKHPVHLICYKYSKNTSLVMTIQNKSYPSNWCEETQKINHLRIFFMPLKQKIGIILFQESI